jgi:HEAT repeat protein
MWKANLIAIMSAVLLVVCCQAAFAADVYDEQGNTVIDEVTENDIPRLIELLGSPDATVHFKAKTFLVSFDGKSVPALIDALEKGQNRVEIIGVLGQLKDPRSIAPLFQYTDSDDQDVNGAARRSLIDMGDKTGPFLVDKLKEKEKTKATVYMLSHIARTDQMALDLRGLLSSPDAELRSASVYLLGEWRDEGSLKGVISLLQDKDKYVREEAIKAYQKITTDYDQNVLIPLLKDEDENVRSMAAELLADVKDANLSLIEGPLMDAAKNDKSKDVRVQAIYALGKQKDLSAIIMFIEALNDPDWEIRDTALGAVVDINAVEAIPYIMSLIKDRKVANNIELRDICNTLVALGKPVELAPFYEYLEKTDDPETAMTILDLMKKFVNDDNREQTVKVVEEVLDKTPDGTLKGYMKDTLEAIRK